MMDLSQKKLFLIDLDGVFYKGKENPIKIGGSKVVRRIRERKKKLLVLTNNSTDTVATIHEHLAKFNIPVRREEILTSGMLTAEYVFQKYGRATYFLIGEKGLDAELRSAGLRRTNGETADVVIVGLDRRLTYDKLDRAVRVINNGARIVASHAARMYMYKFGPAIAAGPTVRALEYATGKHATIIGKPATLMFEMALQKAGCRKGDAVMIGDQIETDILGARRAGIDSVLVLTGVDRAIENSGAIGVVDDIDELVDYI
jgi:4-nitrophenyl phosphatase